MAAGCSAGGQPTQPPAPPPAPPLPPPSRALLGWSNTMCETVGSVDELRTAIDSVNEEAAGQGGTTFAASMARSYLARIPTKVQRVTESLQGVEPAGNAAADGYVDRLVAALEDVQAKLPDVLDASIGSASDEQKLAKARQVAEVIATLDPQAPKLTELVTADPALVASYNLAPNCAPVPHPGAPAGSAPVRPLVSWTNGMCPDPLAGIQKDPLAGPAMNDPRFARAARVQLASYISSARGLTERIAGELAGLPRTGFKAADEYRDSLLAAVRAALPKLPEGRGTPELISVPMEQLVAQAKKVAEVLGAIKPEGPDLRAIVEAEPELLAAYNLAPACEPIDPTGSASDAAPPKASDGTDVEACRDGTCQVQVSAPVDITVNGITFSVSANNGGVSLVDGSGVMHLGSGGNGQISRGDAKVRFHVVDVTDGTAVLEFTMP